MSSPAEFVSQLAPFDVATLDGEPATIYGLTSDLRIGYVNPAWEAFARANGASWDPATWLGSRVLEATPSVLRPAYEQLFDRARAKLEVLEHEYECSSPTRFQRFRMRIYPCNNGALLTVHSLVRTLVHPEQSSGALEPLYRDDDGIMTMCSHCRRVRRVDRRSAWEWVADFVAHLPSNVSHGLCRLCSAHYYAGAIIGFDGRP